ncbi:MAG: diguanylate cyclase, partial [Alphaproteobacteria bacterium]|nr:diguanylate cyclase [Alphaproteobacteria bacterium]
MTEDRWFQHLSAALTQSGAVAYMWNPSDDHFEWAGDVGRVLGLEESMRPHSNAQLHGLLNPQTIPQRLSALHDALGQQTVGDSVPGFTVTYKLRRSNGTQIDIEETATVQHRTDGQRFVHGFMRVMNADSANGPYNMDGVAMIPGTGTTQSGRITLQRKIEEWMEEVSGSYNATGYLLVVDLDRLALINDAYGARFADELIEKTGRRLHQLVDGSGFVARIDGDVF